MLGVWHQNNLKWLCNVEEISKRANKRLYYLKEFRRARLPAEVGITCYLTKIRPLSEYGAPVWGGLPAYLAAELENIQIRSLDIIGFPTGLPAFFGRKKENNSSRISTN